MTALKRSILKEKWKMTILMAFALGLAACQSTPYPNRWFEEVKNERVPKWEILPQAAKPGEVILSKRNELGLLSNFAATPVFFMGKRYASVEGLWQSMKYPEGPEDPRAQAKGIKWNYTREQVEQMSGFRAKHAGDLASKNMKKMAINWVSFQGKRMTYRTEEKGEHYFLVRQIMSAKLKQNPDVENVLKKTKGLKLRPDHIVRGKIPPAWKYYDIWMDLRATL